MENIQNYKFSVKKRASLPERLSDYRNILFGMKHTEPKNNDENLICKTCGNSVIAADGVKHTESLRLNDKLSTAILYK